MTTDEILILFETLRADIAELKLDIILISHDLTKVREELEQKKWVQEPQESIGLAPSTPPPDFLPPEMM
jgi:hypothetical protein